jgi:hypothetical protein
MNNCARNGSDPFQQVLGRDLQLLIRQSDVGFDASDPDDHASGADFFRFKTRGKHGHPCRDYDHERKEPATGSENAQLLPRVALTTEDLRTYTSCEKYAIPTLHRTRSETGTHPCRNGN